MIRRLAETLLDAAGVPDDVREVFFPSPPEVFKTPPPVRQSGAPVPGHARRTELSEATSIEEIVDELVVRRPDRAGESLAGDVLAERRRRRTGESVAGNERAARLREFAEDALVGDRLERQKPRMIEPVVASRSRINVQAALADRSSIRRAFVLGEILKPPMALRDQDESALTLR